MALLTRQFPGNQQTDIYINWHSHSTLQSKKTIANVLIQRAIKICSDEKFSDEELGIIKHNLREVNNYPGNLCKISLITTYNKETV